MPPGHTDQHLFTVVFGDPRLNKLANELTRYVRVRRVKMKTAWDHTAIEKFYREIHIIVR